MEERKPRFNGQMRKADIKKDAQIIQRELAEELKNITKPDDTVAALNKAVDGIIQQEAEKLRQLKMGDAILKYIRTAEDQQKKMGEVLAQAAKANAELLRLNNEREVGMLSVEQMRALLHREIPRIKVENHYPDLLAEVDGILTVVTQESDKLKSEMTRMLLDQTNAQNAKYNLLIILFVIILILQFIF